MATLITELLKKIMLLCLNSLCDLMTSDIAQFVQYLTQIDPPSLKL
jgi:hypothetical protein